MVDIKATITAIGPEAISPTDPLVILFDEDATVALKQIALLQEFESEDAMSQLTLVPGDQLAIDDQVYHVEYVGEVANDNLQTIGHATLLFTPVPETDRLGNGVYLTPYVKPDFKVGTTITYHTN
jgi:PTS system glucitol/sorbitol-specific IIA component